MTGKQLDRLLDILDRFAGVAEKWASSEYPEKHDTEEEGEVGIYKQGRHDEPTTKAEYDAFPEAPGRFERLIGKNPQA